MSTLFDVAGFLFDNGIWVAAGSALTLGLAMFLPMMLSRSTRLKPSSGDVSLRASAVPLTAGAGPAAIADPMELLRSFSRARGAHLVMIGDNRPSPFTKQSPVEARRAAILSFEAFLRLYRRIPKDRPIDVLILHGRPERPPLDLSDARRVAKLLMRHKGKVTVIVPYQGTGHVCLLALAGDEVIIGEDATLAFDTADRGHTIAAARLKRPRNMSDESLLEHHALLQEVRETEWLATILLRHKKVRRWRSIARAIAAGTYNTSRPARIDDLRSWGLRARAADLMEGFDLPSIDGAGVALYSKQRHETGRKANLSEFAPVCSDTCPTGDVRDAMRELEQRRGSRVISIVHTPGAASDSVDDMTTAEAVRAIRSAPAGTNLDIILHTPGGDSAGADKIVRALKAHRGKKTVLVPYHAFSAGTMIALTADEIFLTDYASLGPIDVQLTPIPALQAQRLYGIGKIKIGDGGVEDVALFFDSHLQEMMQPYSAAAYASLLDHKRPTDIADSNLQTSVTARTLREEDLQRALESMKGVYRRGRARRIARTLNDGYLSHGFPIMYEEARKIGLNVKLGVPEEVFTIVDSFLARNDGFCSVIHCPD